MRAPADFSSRYNTNAMDDAGQKLKRARERLNLRYRDVEDASLRIAERRRNDEFVVNLSRLSDIENKGTVPNIYKLYTLCAIYRIDWAEVLSWFSVNLDELAADAAIIEIDKTHSIGFTAGTSGDVLLPLALDPGIDVRKTAYLSRMIQRWGKLPLMLLNGLDLKTHRYAYIGADDWFMYPLIQPGSLIQIDESRRKPLITGWTSEHDRPIYFCETRDGYVCGWCSIGDRHVTLMPHPASQCAPVVFQSLDEFDVIGQVIGVAMRLDQGRKRRTRAATATV